MKMKLCCETSLVPETAPYCKMAKERDCYRLWTQKMTLFYRLFSRGTDCVVENDVKNIFLHSASGQFLTCQIRRSCKLCSVIWRNFFAPAASTPEASVVAEPSVTRENCSLLASVAESSVTREHCCSLQTAVAESSVTREHCSLQASVAEPSVTLPAFLLHMETLIFNKQHRKSAMNALRNVAEYTFMTCSCHHNDCVSLAELQSFMTAFGLEPDAVASSFPRLSDGAASVPRARFEQAVLRFFASKENDFGSWLFGALEEGSDESLAESTERLVTES